MTLLEMRTEVYSRLGEQAGFYTDDNLTQWLNDGMDDIALNLEPKVSSAILTTYGARTEYLLPDNLISIKTALYYDSAAAQWRDLQETSYTELFRSNPGWESDTVALIPHMWYWRPEGVIGIYPQPVTGTTNGLRIIYTCRPEEMVEDEDVSHLPTYLDRAIILYAVFRAKLKDRNDEKAVLARAEWEKAVASAAMLINKHRKEHAPRLEPNQNNYRKWWYNRTPHFRATSN
jgi:hypothetical protein